MTIMEWLRRLSKNKNRPPTPKVPDQYLEQHADDRLMGDLKETTDFIVHLLGENEDFMMRPFKVFGEYSAIMLYFANMTDTATASSDILQPLMSKPAHLTDKEIRLPQLKDTILNDALYHSKAAAESKMTMIMESLLRGGTVILVDGLQEAIVVETTKVDKRSIQQPETEQVIRGPREGFIEQLGTNISLLRYRLPTTDLRVSIMKIGRVTKTRVAICYLRGIANQALVEEVKKRLEVIDIDGVLDVGYLEEFIEDNHLSPFPQVQHTERPDKTVANLLEGRVIILADGSPFALIVPSVFNQFYQTIEDYTERFLLVSFIRLTRLLALAFSLVTPSLYVAIISFNPELIPTEFAVAIAGARAGVPFPSVFEVLVMDISMEVLREATLRLPQQIGGALSIVGVLVIGQAAVSAGFVSPITVVVIALTTIGSFATPAYNAALALRLLRFPLVIMAGMFGLYGVMVGLILIANHLLSLRSFGVPYLSPVVPGHFKGMLDTVMRGPLWAMKKRPQMLHPPNDHRVGPDVVDKMNRPPSNTLDPLKVGNQRKEEPNGVPPSNNGNSGSGSTD